MIYKNVGKYRFISEKCNNINLFFSTGDSDLNFNKNTPEGAENIENIKEWFSVCEVGYLEQIHGDTVYNYNGTHLEGDAIITNKSNIAIGIFTADCVPILIFDKSKNVIAAVHSGWRGTMDYILSKTIGKMIRQYGCRKEDIILYIGPHIQKCCYEVGEELIERFKGNDLYGDEVINENRLDLTKCIIKQCLNMDILEKNIKVMNSCTFCDTNNKWFSYRRDKTSNRMFSFIILKD